MLLGGLWHGASWTFVIWGALHGFYLVLERAVRRIVPRRLAGVSLLRLPVAVLTFLLICVASVFFRADSLDQGLRVSTTLLGFGPDDVTRLLRPEPIVLSLGITVLLLSIHWLMRDRTLAEVTARIPWWARSLAMAAMLVAILGFSGEDHAFIYFQF